MRSEFRDWLEARRLSEQTVESYLLHFDLLLKEMEKDHKGDDQKFINRFVKRHPTFITRAFLTNFKEFAEEKELGLSFSVPKVKGRQVKKKRRLMSEQDAKAIRRWLLKNKHYKYVLMFDLTDKCALRRIEACSIKPEDFYWSEWSEGEPCRLSVVAKGKERIVIVPPQVMKRIKKYILKYRDKLEEHDTLFFCNKKTWNWVMTNAVKEACDHKFTPHDLRRRRATIWINNGLGMENVRIRLGHSSIATTQKYVLLDEETELSKWSEEYD